MAVQEAGKTEHYSCWGLLLQKFRSSGLQRGRFVKIPQAQRKWCDTDKQDTSSSTVSHWFNKLAKLSSAYSEITKHQDSHLYHQLPILSPRKPLRNGRKQPVIFYL